MGTTKTAIARIAMIVLLVNFLKNFINAKITPHI